MCDLLPAYSVARSKVSADTSNTARNRYLLGTCSQNIAGDSSDGDSSDGDSSDGDTHHCERKHNSCKYKIG